MMSTFPLRILSLAFLFFIPMNGGQMQRELLAIDVFGNGQVQKEILKSGYGEEGPPNTSYVTINYKVIRTNNAVMYQHRDFEFQIGVGNVICCLDLAVATMQAGEVSRIRCDKNYVNSEQKSDTLDFEIELIKWSEPQKARSLHDIYGVTCSDVHEINEIESNIRRLGSIQMYNDMHHTNYDKWSFYVLCTIAIMNFVFLPYSCMQWIGCSLNVSNVYDAKQKELHYHEADIDSMSGIMV